MKQITKLFFSILALVVALNWACSKDDTPKPPPSGGDNAKENDMVMYWNEKVATVLGIPMPPTARARQFAICELAVHDALNSIRPIFQHYAFNNPMPKADPDAAVASAAYWVIRNLNIQGTFPIDDWYQESLAKVGEGQAKEEGKELGKLAADAIVEARKNDGFDKVLYAATVPFDGTKPGEYRSTLAYENGSLVYLDPPLKRVPNWGTVMVPLVVRSNAEFHPEGPYDVTSAKYAADFKEVKMKGGKNSRRSQDEEALARFWSDNRNVNTWNNITRAVVKGKAMDAWETARLFALAHIAMLETANVQLNAGYKFYFWRPETAIRLADTDGNKDTEADKDWLPFIDEVPNTFPTPPVPGYPNIYATYGGAVSAVLKRIFHNATQFSLSSEMLPGVTLNFDNVDQAASSNSLAIIYLGWDFRKSVMDGEAMGRQIGDYIVNNACQRR